MASDPQDVPPTLLDLLSNSLILRHTAPFLSVKALFALSATSREFQSLVLKSPECHRYLDLTTVKSAVADAAPIDVGGTSWRHERMDEALTEDEFYSGPLRGIFSKLERRHILENVYTLVLDGLTVPADLVREIIAEDRFQVRILSIREAKHLNERKLRQVLEYAVRPGRAEGTPKLRGLYIFGPKEKAVLDNTRTQKPARNDRSSPSPSRPPPPMPPTTTRTTTEAISAMSISSGWNQRSQDALKEPVAGNDEKWYQPSGQLLKRPYTSTGSDWAATMKACEGIIHFDAVLCRGPRHDPEYGLSATGQDTASSSYLPPTIASIALGPSGCANCGSCPEEPATFGASPPAHFPLLSPPALQVATIKACQAPFNLSDGRLILRCESCLKHRWCERCHKWWCENCFTSPPANWTTRTDLQQREAEGEYIPTEQEQQRADAEMLKVKLGHCMCIPCWAEWRAWRQQQQRALAVIPTFRDSRVPRPGPVD
jgi:hypothetical protein